MLFFTLLKNYYIIIIEDEKGSALEDMFMSGGCMYANSKLATARELAKRPEAADNPSLQYEICQKNGVFLEDMTEDEIAEFERMIQEFVNIYN